ncbi:histidine kinase dimerization/phospho-acceptor domain-containing protein [Clostridioides difficile]|uniref:HAMP domain-containing sensor histidine kinase n=1 Tax=Clostridioides difficile TaxID=1496 RepID=UPI000871C90D|nr:histidine kinase dimerization/phospho-acceptor domain-containing protein [Clostridioides difficile]AXU65005.1 two-component sensor histidine kinase [Clostridioides difficile]EJX3383006.1 two-component sensor histidine kinase [Clostridioides difficile]EJX3386305.1 two-component sensor histidine kinase [Clostridioides difficile]MBN6004003.1 two-component sensor histidine kinase [Clostridioides difficile]MCU5987012.1 two-component sensor histidine kinase [Clostridioides difficile]
MDKYRVLKLVSLIIISISFPLTILLVTIGLAETKYNIQKTSTKSGIFDISDDFYDSNIFDKGTMASLLPTFKLSVGGKLTSKEKGKFQQEGKSTDLSSSDSEYDKIMINEQASEEYLGYLKNIKVYVINTYTGVFYTNTSYSNLYDFKQKTKSYCNVEIINKIGKSSYIKTINGEKFELNNLSLELDEVYEVDEGFEAYISFPEEPTIEDGIVYTNFQIFKQATEKVRLFFVASLSLAIICLLSIILYSKIKGEVLKRNNVFLLIYSKIPMEFNVILVSISIAILTMYALAVSYHIDVIALVSLSLLIVSNNIFFINVQLSYLENKMCIFQTSIIVRLILWLIKTVREISNAIKKVSLARKVIVIVIISLALIMVISTLSIGMGLLFSICIFLGFTIYITKRLSYLSYVIEGTERIKKGELDYKIKITGNDNFTSLAENINNIGEGLDRAIEEQVKSERMKSDLITNVSHDLKTPLTSIINYVDLIKKEESIQPEYINDYINVLESKSKRLKLLIEDLFEASRVSSGNIELQISKIDLVQLLRQSIGELEEKLSKNNLYLKLNVPNDKVYIWADGRRMYRVFENLLSNIAKYSLEETRVYIDVYDYGENVKVTMKNISSYELNFDPSEIMERFKRADESRNTEGSGLGLAIARDLVDLQGGKFYIEIDGDLFKANLEFQKYEEEITNIE